MSDTFSEDDLLPSDEERAAERRDSIDRVAGALAAIAGGVVGGGMIALGAAAAPAVFEIAPAPFSGYAMGTAFARFDRIAIGGAAFMLLCEVVRTFLARHARQRPMVRIRRLAAVFLAGAVTFMGLSLSPGIRSLHDAGARRGVGAEGDRLEALHRQAELVGKLEVALALVAAGLHVLTIRRRSDDEEDELAAMRAPAPPGGD